MEKKMRTIINISKYFHSTFLNIYMYNKNFQICFNMVEPDIKEFNIIKNHIFILD